MAFDDVPAPDFADVVIVAIPSSADEIPADPEWWAERVFNVRSAPWWVRALLGLRQALVGLVGIPKGDASAFDVAHVRGEEALIATNDRHLDFRAAIGIDVERRLLRITTAVVLHGWRGRLYFAPVSFLHGPVTRSLAQAAVRRLRGGEAAVPSG